MYVAVWTSSITVINIFIFLCSVNMSSSSHISEFAKPFCFISRKGNVIDLIHVSAYTFICDNDILRKSSEVNGRWSSWLSLTFTFCKSFYSCFLSNIFQACSGYSVSLRLRLVTTPTSQSVKLMIEIWDKFCEKQRTVNGRIS